MYIPYIQERAPATNSKLGVHSIFNLSYCCSNFYHGNIWISAVLGSYYLTKRKPLLLRIFTAIIVISAQQLTPSSLAHPRPFLLDCYCWLSTTILLLPCYAQEYAAVWLLNCSSPLPVRCSKYYVPHNTQQVHQQQLAPLSRY